jgi:tRNA1Val (adenine37-N6)-methyltransferase
MSSLLLDETDLTDDALTDRVRVLQRRRGHRYSVDDVATAWVAIRARPHAATHLDLGCGLGSVLLMVADRLPWLRAVGVEAQAGSFALAERNIARNGLAQRVSVYRIDLRDNDAMERSVHAHAMPERGFDVVTGTPPYKPLGSASVSPDSQRAYARVEMRGGVEAYLSAAARALAPQGVFVMCAETAQEARVQAGARAAGLRALQRLDVIPMQARKQRLFSVHCFVPDAAAASSEHAAPPQLERLVLRDAQGARTPASLALRSFFGLTIDARERPSPPRAVSEGGLQ